MIPSSSSSSSSFLINIAILGLVGAQQQQQSDLTQYVQPFMGSSSSGNMFPGAARPFGVVKLGPDVFKPGVTAYSGYLVDGNITGFSMLHESGTGGSPKYGVVAQMPIVGTLSGSSWLNGSTGTARQTPDYAEVGYYRSALASGVTVELAASDHAGMLRYAFPKSADGKHVLVDLSHLPGSFRKQGLDQQYVRGNMTLTADGQRYEGMATYNHGWNRAPDWNIYFCGRFDSKPSRSQTFIMDSATVVDMGKTNAVDDTRVVGAVFSFDSTNVTSTVGVSFVSSAKACAYADSEIPTNTKFEDLVNATKSIWNTNVLSKMTTTDTNKTNLQLLYSSLYGMHLLPSNRTGDNPSFSSTEPYYDDIYTLWDLFRCTTPLFHLLQPTFYTDFLRSMISVYKAGGYLPDARSSNFNGRIQGGTNADNVLADAYVKGVRHPQLNWDTAYAAMRHDAEDVPPPNHDPMAPDSSTKEGRGALPDWHRYGFITPNFTRAVSRAVEYSGNDFALYTVASGLGKAADKTTYLNRSRNWRNHWNPSVTSLGFKGFIVQRRADGSFLPHEDPLDCGGCYWAEAYYEALPWEYSFGAHHDMSTLVSWMGGPTTFVSRLDALFAPGAFQGRKDHNPRDTIFNPGNEPSFASPYLYNFARKQDRSAEVSRGLARAGYGTGPGGLPGNSDAGAMQSWLLWNMLGLYPLTGQTTFLVAAAPWFDDLTVDLGAGRKLRIVTTSSSQGNASRAEDMFIHALTVNGKPHKDNWLPFSLLYPSTPGGTTLLNFTVGSNAVAWDAESALPPSPATEGTTPSVPPEDWRLRPVRAHKDARKEDEGGLRARDKALIALGVVLLVGVAAAVGAWWWVSHGRRRSRGGEEAKGEVGSGASSTRETATTTTTTGEV